MSKIPSHPACAWMPAMSREAPVHLYSKADHVAWLTASLGAKRLLEDPEFEDLMAKWLAKWKTMTSDRERRYAQAWDKVLSAQGDGRAAVLMGLDATGVAAREAMPDGFAYLDQAMRVSLRVKAEEQFEDGLVTYARP